MGSNWHNSTTINMKLKSANLNFSKPKLINNQRTSPNFCVFIWGYPCLQGQGYPRQGVWPFSLEENAIMKSPFSLLLFFRRNPSPSDIWRGMGCPPLLFFCIVYLKICISTPSSGSKVLIMKFVKHDKTTTDF